ncbi:MAG: tetratricopeptide repeat protein [Candidatus Latescibacterota bacterium]
MRNVAGVRFKKGIVPGLLILSLFLAGAGISGCAYFNSFYLAKKNYKDGERFRKRGADANNPEAKKFYSAAIENGAIILQDYKDSRYVDDSLFIMGMSYYHTRDFTRARTKFDELLAAFPKSSFAEEAKYYRARCFMELDRIDQARMDLSELTTLGSRAIRGQAGLTLAEINFRAGQWSELIVAAEGVIKSEPDDNILSQAVLYRGEALYNLEKYDEAVESFRTLTDKKKLKPQEKFRVNTRIALSMAKLGKYDEALKYLESMQSRGEFAVFAPSIRLEMGRILELKGDTPQALDTFTKMAADFPDSVAAREAWHRVGVITLRDLSKAQDARDAFAKVTPNMKVAETWFTDALAKVTQIDSLKTKTERIEKLDEKPEEKAHERFLLAELLTWSLDHKEDALSQYAKIIEEAPDTEFAARSHFLLGRAELEKSGSLSEDTENEVMRKTVEQYPASHFSQDLKVRLGIIEAPPDIVLLKAAELARMSNQGPDVYLPLYQAVADSFPESRAAYQSRFIMAYAHEHDKHDRDAAFKMYRALAAEKQNENNRDFVNLASKKVNLIMDEEKILEQSRKNIAYYESEIGREEIDAPSGNMVSMSSEENGYSEFRKIRARNARIRSRYYSE